MIDLDAYFARIGYSGPREPTLEVLTQLQALHPAAIPFEAIDCLLDRDIDLSPQAVDAKLIHAGRGGYCFEQNGLFRRVLTALGFETQGLNARVRWNMPPTPLRPRTHMVIRVEIEGVSWLADVGFGGCVITAPLRLETGLEQATPHDRYRLTAIAEGVRLECRREAGWLPAWDLSLEPCVPADYEMANWYTSKFPESHFRHLLIAAKTTADARFALRANRLAVRPRDGQPTLEILDAAGIAHHLRHTFGLPVEPSWTPLFHAAAASGGSAD